MYPVTVPDNPLAVYLPRLRELAEDEHGSTQGLKGLEEIWQERANDEEVWLQEFMSIRRSVLLNPDNQETQEEWSQSVGRIDTLIELYQSGNVLLTPPIVIDTWGDIDRLALPLQTGVDDIVFQKVTSK